MKRKSHIISILFIIFLGFNNHITASAFHLETLNESSDYQDIQEMEAELFECGMAFAQEGTSKEDLRIAYEKAVKIYVDTNIFESEKIDPEKLENILSHAVYLWEVPVELPTGGYVICTVSRALPIDEAVQQELLNQGIYTQEELNEQLAKTGQWEIPAYGYDETGKEYIGHLEDASKEQYDPEDSDMVYLLGGTPNFRQPFGLWCHESSYQIISISDSSDLTLQQASAESALLEETGEQPQSASFDTDTDSPSVYSFEEVQEILSHLPSEQNDKVSGLGVNLEDYADGNSSETTAGNIPAFIFAGIAALLILTVGAAYIVIHKKRTKY